MLFPTVTEDHVELEAVGPDTFVDDLDRSSADATARRAALIQWAAKSPQRRVFD